MRQFQYNRIVTALNIFFNRGQMNIEIFSKENCVYCNRAKALLLQKGLNFVEHVIGKDYTREAFMEKFPNAKTVPQVIINGEHVGGFEQLTEWTVNYDKSRFIQD